MERLFSFQHLYFIKTRKIFNETIFLREIPAIYLDLLYTHGHLLFFGLEHREGAGIFKGFVHYFSMFDK